MAHRCSKCRKTFDVSLVLFDRREIRVASCRVCPSNNVFSVCGKCADVAQVEQGACPSCGARGMWDVRGMVPSA